MGEYDRNDLEIPTIPEIFREHGYWTANHQKDDYNFHWEPEKLYNFHEKSGLSPASLLDGKMLEGRGEMPFFCRCNYLEEKVGLRDSKWCNLSR